MAFNENTEDGKKRRSAEEVKRFPCLRYGVLYKPIGGINARHRGFKFHAARRDYSFPCINSPKKDSPWSLLFSCKPPRSPTVDPILNEHSNEHVRRFLLFLLSSVKQFRSRDSKITYYRYTP